MPGHASRTAPRRLSTPHRRPRPGSRPWGLMRRHWPRSLSSRCSPSPLLPPLKTPVPRSQMTSETSKHATARRVGPKSPAHPQDCAWGSYSGRGDAFAVSPTLRIFAGPPRRVAISPGSRLAVALPDVLQRVGLDPEGRPTALPSAMAPPAPPGLARGIAVGRPADRRQNGGQVQMRYPEVVEVVQQVLGIGEGEPESVRPTAHLHPVSGNNRKCHISQRLTQDQQRARRYRKRVSGGYRQVDVTDGIVGIQLSGPLLRIAVMRHHELHVVVMGVEAQQE
ncbi:Uncharacterised protein [Mycobacterium tuberculosis]|nr:Uncharacterised protein [Mycobacterium tuberculosis]CKP31868.1 Uncharacterised protein [Mycobacterium tuberculosis]CKP35688.1 Uncharacterised protein [Mycobacterium tuberculosis]CKP44590.1 Uncharacterised protein [Mycobacterium tuberculosis]CKY96384.1 Uncharacterised protein [Mycobacterium tuberculosis]